MAEKLSIQIALDGGEEIQRQLADIGEAGQKAFEEIAKAAEQAGGFKNLKPDEVTAKLKQMGIVGADALKKIQDAVAGATRIERLAGGVATVENAFASLGAGIAGMARVLGPLGAVAGVAIGGIAKAAADAAEGIAKIEGAAARAGQSIATFDKLAQALEKGGISSKGIAAGIQKISEAVEKGKVDKVAKDLAELQEARKSGSGGVGAQQRLMEAAKGLGPAAAEARKGLEKLGERLPPAAGESLSDLAAKAGTVQQAMAAFIQQLEGIKDPAERNAEAFRQMGEAGLEISRGINTGAISSRQFAQQMAADANTITQAQADMASSVEQSNNRMAASWERFKITGDISHLGDIWEEFSGRLSTAVDISIEQLGTLISKIGELASKAGGAIWDTFTSAGKAAFETVTGWIDDLIKKFKDAAEWAGKVFGGGGEEGEVTPAPGNARGGLIGGRGTGTSDSNLSWVSRGEHIMPARAVRQPGVLAFLEGLRRNGGDLRALLNGMGRFASGGLVAMPAMANAGGGGMRNIGTIDLRTDAGNVSVMASFDAVEQLQRLVVTRRMTSTSVKKPGFVA